MKRISIVLLTLAVAAVISCINHHREIVPNGDEEAIEIKPGMYTRKAAGFAWEFMTPDQNDPETYFYTGSRRIYYAKASEGYTRACTLRVTKTAQINTSPVVFNIYDHEATCLILSSGSSETGNISYGVWTEKMNGQLTPSDWKGYIWELPSSALESAPIGTYLEFTFTVTLPEKPGACPEGKIFARMKSPVDIPSADRFWDGDVFSIAQNASR